MTLVRGSEAQGGSDREGEEDRPFGIGEGELERGGEEAVGDGWQARVSAEGEMWLGELAEGRGVVGWLMGWSTVGENS